MSSESELDFADRVATFFEHEGFPPIAGRVVGWLLICEPREQSAAELAETLGASRSSIGNATRMLTTSGIVRGVRRRGERQESFRIDPDAWSRMLAERYGRTTAFREVIEHGLDVLADQPAPRRDRLEAVHELYRFLESELPALWARWEATRGNVARTGGDDTVASQGGLRAHPPRSGDQR
ncbi:GbsR/MarR family transcriptional regulator [Spiractinospora alimapuensis]|uniref:GbsR/MarR family transcriptional regulator n=1 Tax=Spiractinospora alimapuensis TaxID=2820884 RepID=UPI001F1C2154|nr:MarR family transcriptional regulator [Spiractinospora alimapuensis]